MWYANKCVLIEGSVRAFHPFMHLVAQMQFQKLNWFD